VVIIVACRLLATTHNGSSLKSQNKPRRGWKLQLKNTQRRKRFRSATRYLPFWLSRRFLDDWVGVAKESQQGTVRFYRENYRKLLDWRPWVNLPIDEIDEPKIDYGAASFRSAIPLLESAIRRNKCSNRGECRMPE
jgi:hypothetical protein